MNTPINLEVIWMKMNDSELIEEFGKYESVEKLRLIGFKFLKGTEKKIKSRKNLEKTLLRRIHELQATCNLGK